MKKGTLPWQTCFGCGIHETTRYSGAIDIGSGTQPFAWLCVKCANTASLTAPPSKLSDEEIRMNACKRIGIPESYFEASVQNCQASKEIQKLALKWVYSPQGPLVISGPVGTGKTYLATLVLRHYAYRNKGSTVRFKNISHVRSLWKTDQSTAASLRYELTMTDCLLMDDIGIVPPSDAFLEFLFDIINFRMNERKATIYTTNLTGKELYETLGPQIGSRIIKSNSTIVKIDGPDKRESFAISS